MSKILSGRWLLTVVAAIVFLYTSIAGILRPVETKEILMLVIVFYFSKARQGGENG